MDGIKPVVRVTLIEDDPIQREGVWCITQSGSGRKGALENQGT